MADPQGIRWTNRSVLKLAGTDDPIVVIERRARELALRGEEHDVLQLDTASLIAAHKDRISFCPINSGTTKPFPHPRGNSTFSRIANYPYSTWKEKRQKGERVVELCVDYAVPDITNFVTKVVRMKSDQELRVLFQT